MHGKEQKLNNSSNIKCPKCNIFLLKEILHNIEVDYCYRCLGLWFEDGELRLAKDQKDKDLQWMDIDLWEKEDEFKVSYGIRICPSCRVPLYEVRYGDSGVIVDICNLCQGIWLDRGEFKKIINWLKKKADYELLNNYSKNLVKEFSEIFTGPEPLKEEISDFITVVKLLKYKILIKNPKIASFISNLPG